MKVALVVIYNHRYDKNIPIVEKLYEGKFSNIFHVVPFYEGDRENVITVFESSYRFQGYIAQAYKELRKKGFSHYFIVADDMLINPKLDETNFLDKIGLSENDCFIPNIVDLSKSKGGWTRLRNAIMWWPELSVCGAEFQNELPKYEEAESQIKRYGKNVVIGGFLFLQSFVRGIFKEAPPRVSYKIWKRFVKNGFKYPLCYPMVASYSDICIVSESAMPRFSHYCGALAAAGLFIEVAWPTSLLLASDSVKTEDDTLLKGRALWPNNGWHDLDKYQYDLKRLKADFPQGQLFIHPVKLSKWK